MEQAVHDSGGHREIEEPEESVCWAEVRWGQREDRGGSGGQGEVTAQLDGLDPQHPIEILEKYRLNFSIDEDQAASELLVYKEKIN